MSETLILVLFHVFIVLMLVLDLGVFQRRVHFPSMKEALTWSIVWVVLALLFNLFVFFELGHVKALEFLAGYVVEEALSIDNIFIFVVIFNFFAVPAELQHRVLFWGVLSAIAMRAVFIVAGASLVAQFHWILYIFGAFLIVTAVRLALARETALHPERNPVVRFCRKAFPVTAAYEGSSFFVKKNGKRAVTPLFLVLMMIETTDLAFATDSIPAIFAITRDPIIIYTSNIFAILGLRNLYFVLANVMKKFRYLKTGLSVVLAFIGLKMLAEPWFGLPIHTSIIIIFAVLAVSVAFSLAAGGEGRGKGKPS